MEVKLTPEDAQNVKVALLSLAKSPQVNEEGMKVLLILSDKFTTNTTAPSSVDLPNQPLGEASGDPAPAPPVVSPEVF